MTINPHAAPRRTRYASSRPVSHAPHSPRPTISLRALRPDSVGQYTNLPPPAQQEHFKRNGSVSTDAQYIRVELLPRTPCSNQNGSRAPPEVQLPRSRPSRN